ncbi:three-Cys-motif partner protein TcmP [Methanolapillus millepedarum]|uniref:Three-Cys-motif partner protein TcmP n=1 Tax=Methanolapillus millepedarum TaxID=3028296 RepID=A0AA96V5E6_9EURY|nr:hypothetical protein MsAc7_09030 [Methanosarcinaceae archaeon Ac7]
MSKDNSDFFKVKNEWSAAKDELLACYLKPYFAKIVFTRHPVQYIDCFSGKGMFEDGTNGSPIIALDIAIECLEKTKSTFAKIDMTFIEMVHADDLKTNLDKYSKSVPELKTSIISGKYEDYIEKLLQRKQKDNVFLYIDPFGIKAIDFSIFDRLSKKNFYSLELLINLNSFGFIREACRVMKVSFDIVLDDFFIESAVSESLEGSIQILTMIAGGDYWKEIINDMKNGVIDGYEAEKIFAEEYCRQLKMRFKYVLDMPVRLKQGHRPKYRMIHATNHEDGCLLMNENMYNRWQTKILKLQSGGQQKLFPEDSENNIIDYDFIKSKLLEMVKSNEDESGIEINILLAEFISKHGARYSTKDIRDQVKILDNENKIEIFRVPAKTKTGKDSSFWEPDKKQSLKIKAKKK